MTTLLEFPTAPPLPPEPDHISLTYQGGEYWFTPAELRAHCRYTKEQLVAILAMRSSGIAEEIIEQAFPPKIVPAVVTPMGPSVAPGTRDVSAAAPPGSSPPEVAAAPPVTQHRSRCEHNRQQEPDPAGNIRCMKCDKIIIRGAGFVDNTNHSWNGMSRQGAAAFDPRVRQLIGADGKAHFEPAFRGELA